jgi:hypothetical protein
MVFNCAEFLSRVKTAMFRKRQPTHLEVLDEAEVGDQRGGHCSMTDR